MTYADTGEVVNFGFQQYVTDIDCNNRWNSYGATEGVTFGNGYNGNLYVYRNCRLNVNGNYISVPNDGRNHNISDFSEMECSNSGGEVFVTGDPRVTEASDYMNACWGVTSGGSFSVTFHGGNFSMNGAWYSPMLTNEKPVKTVSVDTSDMSKVDWNIRYDMPDLYAEVFDKLGSFGFIDVIPAEHRYVGWNLYLGNTDISNQAIGSYDASTRKLTVELKRPYLDGTEVYGKELRLCVHCTWVNGARKAVNTPVVHLNDVIFEGRPVTVANPGDVTAGLTKFVVNPKSSYGPGDVVEYFVAINFEDYDPVELGSHSGGDNTWTVDNLISHFSFEDLIPGEMELVGKPRVYNMGLHGEYSTERYPLGNWITQDHAYTKDEVRKLQLQRGYLSRMYIKAGNVKYIGNMQTIYQPYVEVPAIAVRDSAGVHSDLRGYADVVRKNEFGLCESLQEYFNTANCINPSYEDEIRYDTFVPGIHWPEYGFVVTENPNKIAVSTKNDTMFHWGYVTSGYNMSGGIIGIYYQCRIKDGVFDKNLTNVSKMSAQNVSLRLTGHRVIQGAPGSSMISTETYTSYNIPLRINVSAEADATIYVGGYSITTEVVNGVIDSDISNIPGGSNVSVSYTPHMGCYLSYIEVDGVRVDGNAFPSLYNFRNVRQSHHIKVVYERGYSILTEVENGTITPSKLGVPAGSTQVISYQPKDGYMLSSVTVDGIPQTITSYLSSYTFANVQKDHKIKVVYIPKYKITTSITNGTITPTITGITPGSSQTVTYTPDDDHYVESVTVDGVVLPVSELASHLTSYVFTNIHEDHTITVVCKPYCHLNTYVRWRDVNGNWSAYEKVDTATKKQGESYSYTWVRGQLKTEPENVYFDGNPKTVGDTNLSVSKDYYIDVERKQYTYTFDMNPPDGYAVIGIGNQQENLVDKWAETVSGNVKSPSLTGYTFLGWNTKKDGTGQAYMSESMLSNKTFYARWRKNKYKIHYDANGSSNPNHQTGEFTQNTVLGVMADSQYEYDTRGMLRTNAFTRSGYEFLGWNTKADGTGRAYGESAYDVSNKLYSDGYANVWNMTTGDNVTLTLYAQWKKKLGSEVLTVLSEETGNPVANVKVKLYQKTNGTWDERTDVGTLTTNANGQVSVRNLHWFAYEWRCVSVPDGYQKLSDVAFTVKHDALDWRHEVVLYLRRVQIVCQSQVSAIISGERAPSFVYQVSGTDAAGVRHSYMIEVPVSAGTKRGTSKALSCYAGTYTVTQIPVSRYVPENARNVQNFTVSSISGTTNLLTKEKGEVLFPYTLRQYEGFGSVDMKENQFSSDLVEIRSFRDFIQQLFVN